MPVRRACVAAALAMIVALAPLRAAHADGASPSQCAASYADAQRLRQRGQLLAAREASRVCASASCPAVGRTDCATWIGELDRAIPSVIVVARGESDSDARALRVTVDGAPRSDAAQGRAIEIDPGDHTFRVERDGDAPLEQVVTVFQGERDRVLRFELRAVPVAKGPDAPTPAFDGSPSYTPAIALGATSAIALGVSAWLGLSGRNDLSKLRSTCAPTCSDDSVDPVRRKLVASDIALGVGVVAAAFGVYFVVAPPRSAGSSTPAARIELRGNWLGLHASF
jgi:hypothetical protein